MAATGYTPISLYYSTTASAVPTAGNLANGELALNIADMKLYAKNSSGTVTLLASNASTTGVDSLSFGSTGLTPSTATTGAITVAGTLNVANGGTGLTSLTANRIPYGNGTSAFQSSANLSFDGNALSVSSTGGATQLNLTDSTSNIGLNANPATGGGFYISNTRVGAPTYIRTSNASSSDVTAIYISSAGNIAMGTLTADSKLRVLDSSGNGLRIGYLAGSLNYNLYDASIHQFRSVNGSTSYVTMDGTGLGIGTSSPSEKLQIDSGNIRLQGTNPGQILFFSTGNGVSQNATLAVQNDGATTNTGEFRFSTKNQGGTLAERFRFGASGQFGIGGANYGSSGQVLTSSGSGSAPTWASPAGGGSMIYISTTTASGSTNVDITGFDSTYDTYIIECPNISTSTSITLGGRFFNSGTIATGTYRNTLVAGASSNQTQTYINLSMGNNFASGITSPIRVIIQRNPNNGKSDASWTFGWTEGSGYYWAGIGMSIYQTDITLSGFRFFDSYAGAANCISGTFKLYGIKKS